MVAADREAVAPTTGPPIEMGTWIKVAGVLALVAIAAVVVIDQMQAADDKAWDYYAEARAGNFTPEALENAREASKGTDAEPWVNWRLAMALYATGSAEDLQRAQQVAESSIQAYPEHQTTAWLRDLVAALKTYEGAGS